LSCELWLRNIATNLGRKRCHGGIQKRHCGEREMPPTRMTRTRMFSKNLNNIIVSSSSTRKHHEVFLPNILNFPALVLNLVTPLIPRHCQCCWRESHEGERVIFSPFSRVHSLQRKASPFAPLPHHHRRHRVPRFWFFFLHLKFCQGFLEWERDEKVSWVGKWEWWEWTREWNSYMI